MNNIDIHEEDWQYIFKKHPGVEATILACGLYNEAKRLTNEIKDCAEFIDPLRKSWVEKRLKELSYSLSGD